MSLSHAADGRMAGDISGHDVSLGEKVRLLSTPGAYPFACRNVRVNETHFAFIFLTGKFAYKLKKPVELGFLSLGTLAARRDSLLNELTLNRRLAGKVYRRLVAVTKNADGLQLGGEGAVVDWVLEMRQLPAARMLDERIATKRLEPGDVECVANLLANFYEQAVPALVEGGQYLDHLEVERNF